MALDRQSPTILKFGTFEADLRAGEVRKQGKRIKLQDQPFQVLSGLLQRPGDVVTREELRSQIWPQDTFVDFDNSLNTAINKLREALGDSADNPRFIETLPRRGYRFLAPVTCTDHKESVSVGPAGSPAWHLKVTVPVAVVLVLAAASGLFWSSRLTHRLTEKDTIVLGDFANSTGDPVFDGTLREGLSVVLEQSPFLSLVPEEGIHQTLRMMGKPANERLTPEITREVCQRMSSTAALDGSIALIGTRYNLILKAVNCANGDGLASTEAQANDKSHVLDALGKMSSEMRSKLGESLSTLQTFNTPLEQATTPSLDALQAYNLGLRSGGQLDNVAALAFFQRATQIDPSFAMAHMEMAGTYTILGDSARAAEESRRAFELRATASELEKLIVEEEYNFYTTGDLIKAQRICEVGGRTYPRNSLFHEDLAQYQMAIGQYEAGLKESLEALRLAAYRGFLYRQIVHAYLLLNRLEEAEDTARKAHSKGLDSHLTDVLYGIAFYRGDSAEMARQMASAAGKPGEEDLLLAFEADVSAYFGHLEKANEFSRRAVDAARRAGEREAQETYLAVSALREALFGNEARARRKAALETQPSSWRDLDFAAALASGFAGDARQAQAIADDLAKRFPEDTIVRFNYLPTLRAKLALLHSRPQKAVDALVVAAPYELGLPALSFYNWPNLYPVYVRGEAYLAAHRGGEAAAEFQKILDHRGVVLNEPIGALAHLQLGRAYALQGDMVKARAAYQDFLRLWKDADLDIPILKQAKAEYAKLM